MSLLGTHIFDFSSSSFVSYILFLFVMLHNPLFQSHNTDWGIVVEARCVWERTHKYMPSVKKHINTWLWLSKKALRDDTHSSQMQHQMLYFWFICKSWISQPNLIFYSSVLLFFWIWIYQQKWKPKKKKTSLSVFDIKFSLTLRFMIPTSILYW